MGAAKMFKRVLPRSLTGQIVLLLVVAVLASQTANLAFMADERRLAVHAAAREQVLERTASIVRLLAETPPRLHGGLLQAVSTRTVRFRLDSESALSAAPAGGVDRFIEQRLGRLIGDRAIEVRARVREPFRVPGWDDEFEHGPRSMHRRMHPEAGRFDDDDDDDDDDDEYEHQPMRHRGAPPYPWWERPPRFLEIALSVHTAAGPWLNVETALPLPRPPWGRTLTWAAIVVLGLSGVAVLMVRRVTRPMRKLAAAAEKAGMGERMEPLDEEGPEDVRETTRAFNRMHERLSRFVEDRTRLLAAISHDLRTPITTLRLRAEFIEDEETRRKVLETLDEMQRMADATLDFAREEAAAEDTRTVDLAALIGSLVDDLADLGHDAVFEAATAVVYACRPVALKRALRNLVENAATYGGRARVGLAETGHDIVITVDDDGPGIPEADLEGVFKPFVRLEASRSHDTGGIGLGLAIARSIVRGHGGDIGLENRAGGGLRATVRLPKGG